MPGPKPHFLQRFSNTAEHGYLFLDPPLTTFVHLQPVPCAVVLVQFVLGQHIPQSLLFCTSPPILYQSRVSALYAALVISGRRSKSEYPTDIRPCRISKTQRLHNGCIALANLQPLYAFGCQVAPRLSALRSDYYNYRSVRSCHSHLCWERSSAQLA